MSRRSAEGARGASRAAAGPSAAARLASNEGTTQVLPSWIFEKVEEIARPSLGEPAAPVAAGRSPSMLPGGASLPKTPLNGRGRGAATVPPPGAGPHRLGGQPPSSQPVGLSEWLQQQAQLSWQQKPPDAPPAQQLAGRAGQCGDMEGTWAAQIQAQQQAAARQQVAQMLTQLQVAELLEEQQRQLVASRLMAASQAPLASQRATYLALQLGQLQQAMAAQAAATAAAAAAHSRQPLRSPENMPPVPQVSALEAQLLARAAARPDWLAQPRDLPPSPLHTPPELSPLPSPHQPRPAAYMGWGGPAEAQAAYGGPVLAAAGRHEDGQPWPPLAPDLAESRIWAPVEAGGGQPPASMQSPAAVLSQGLMRVGLGGDTESPWQRQTVIERTSSEETSAQSLPEPPSRNAAPPGQQALRRISTATLQELANSIQQAERQAAGAEGGARPQGLAADSTPAALEEVGDVTNILKCFLASDVAEGVAPNVLPGLLAASLKAQALTRNASQSSAVQAPGGGGGLLRVSSNAEEARLPQLAESGAQKPGGSLPWLSAVTGPEQQEGALVASGPLAAGLVLPGPAGGLGAVSANPNVPPASQVIGPRGEGFAPVETLDGGFLLHDPVARTVSFGMADFLNDLSFGLLPMDGASGLGMADGIAPPPFPAQLTLERSMESSMATSLSGNTAPAQGPPAGWGSPGDKGSAGSPAGSESGQRGGEGVQSYLAGDELDPYGPLDHLLLEPYQSFEGDLLLAGRSSNLAPYAAYEASGALGGGPAPAPAPLEKRLTLARGLSFVDSWMDGEPAGPSEGEAPAPHAPAVLSPGGGSSISSLSGRQPHGGGGDGAILGGVAPTAGSGNLASVDAMQFASSRACDDGVEQGAKGHGGFPGGGSPPGAVQLAPFLRHVPQGWGTALGSEFPLPFRGVISPPPAGLARHASASNDSEHPLQPPFGGGMAPGEAEAWPAGGAAPPVLSAPRGALLEASFQGQREQQQRQRRQGPPSLSPPIGWFGAPAENRWHDGSAGRSGARSPLKRERSKSVAEWDKGLAKRQVGPADPGGAGGPPGGATWQAMEASSGHEGSSSITDSQYAGSRSTADLLSASIGRQAAPLRGGGGGGGEEEDTWGDAVQPPGGRSARGGGSELVQLLKHAEGLRLRISDAEGRRGAKSAPPSPQGLPAQVRREKIGLRLHAIRSEAASASREAAAAMAGEVTAYLKELEAEVEDIVSNCGVVRSGPF